MSDRTPIDYLGLALALVVFFGLAFMSIRQGAPLGHDEAVYSLRASWTAGDEAVNLSGYWFDYRAPGLPWVLSLTWLVRSTEPYLRLVVAAFGAAGVVLTWWMAFHLFGRRAALAAAAGLAMSPWWISPSVHVWPDVPGATLGLGTLALLVWASRGDRVTWWAVWAAPMVILTTIVRFGAPLSLLVGAAALCWWRWDAVKQSVPIVAVTALGAGLGTALVLFTRLVSDGLETPFSAVSHLRSRNGGSIREGFLGYWEVAESQFATPVAVALFAGVMAALVLGRSHPRRKSLFFVGFVALGTFVVLAGSLHAEVRYLSPALPFLWILAGFGLAELTRQWSKQVIVPIALVVMIPLVLGTTAVATEEAGVLKDRFTVLKDSMQSFPWPEECRIATSFTPQVGWYSGCQVVGLRSEGDPLPSTEGVTHIVDVFGSDKEPESLETWLLDHSVEEAVYGDPTLGPMRAVTVLVPKD